MPSKEALAKARVVLAAWPPGSNAAKLAFAQERIAEAIDQATADAAAVAAPVAVAPALKFGSLLMAASTMGSLGVLAFVQGLGTPGFVEEGLGVVLMLAGLAGFMWYERSP